MGHRGCPSAALGLSVQARASTTEPQAGKGLWLHARGPGKGWGQQGKQDQKRCKVRACLM